MIHGAKAPPCVLGSQDNDVMLYILKQQALRHVFRDMSPQMKARIESFLGKPFGFGEKCTHCIYLVFNEDKPIGFIHPHSESGKYDAIEILWVYTLEGRIGDIIIQRSRELVTKELRSESYRSQFRNKLLTTSFVFLLTNGLNEGIITPVKDVEDVSYYNSLRYAV